MKELIIKPRYKVRFDTVRVITVQFLTLRILNRNTINTQRLKRINNIDLSLNIDLKRNVIKTHSERTLTDTFRNITINTVSGGMIKRKIENKYITDIPENPTETDLIIDIPFPYKYYTDTEFFLTDASRETKLLIPNNKYRRINENQIWLIYADELEITKESEIRFTFCHDKNRSHIKVVEYHIMTNDVLTTEEDLLYYVFDIPDTPYNRETMIKNRSMVFYDRKELISTKQFIIDNEKGKLKIIKSSIRIKWDKQIDIIFFYTGTENNKAIQNLPESGYFCLRRHEIDRNYNNNLMAVFVNGKLIPRNNIIEMSNNIYKINKDINSRYNIEVRNMSPKINSLVPFYKRMYEKAEVPKKGYVLDLPSRVQIGGPPHGRFWINSYKFPITFNSRIFDNDKLWISFIQRSRINHCEQPIKYTIDYDLYLYRDDYREEPETVFVTMELREKGNIIRMDRESPKSEEIVLTQIPGGHVSHIDEEYCYNSVQLSRIIDLSHFNRMVWPDNSLNNKLADIFDSISIRMWCVYPNPPGKIPLIFYKLVASGYEKDDHTIGIFEVVISTERNGKGTRLWVNHLDFIPEELYNKMDSKYHSFG